MGNTQNLEKRIKRHVIGKPRSFFAATLPGIEPLCSDELLLMGIPEPSIALDRGGVTFSGRVHDCYLANLTLRTANRILMRLAVFTATNFRRLEKEISEIPWELYLKNNTACEINVSSKRSRLIHTKAIAERISSGIQERLQKPVNNHPVDNARLPQTIFVRVENDHFHLSIDSSGDLLHKRGLKVQGGKAPVRETIAAAVLTLAGYQPGSLLIDPMCGSGTFSLEGAMIAKNIPAGWYRDFAFMDWPCFRPSRWNHIRGKAGENITTHEKPIIFASDTDADAVKKLSEIVKHNQFFDAIHVTEADFFELQPKNMDGLSEGLKQPGFIVINPPYGRRLGSKGNAGKMIARINEKLKKDFRGWRFAIFLPEKSLLAKISFKTNTYNVIHGGLSITVATGIIH